MKTLLAIAAAGLCLWSCQKELDPANEPLHPVLAPSPDAPSFTQAALATLLTDQEDEDAFFAKVELLTYAVTRFLGEHGNLGGSGDLAVGVPCDLGLLDDLELLRTLGGLGGMDAQSTKATLGRYIEQCILDHDPRGAGAVQPTVLFDNLMASLVHEGIRYDLRTKSSPTPANGNPPKIYLSHGMAYSGGTLKTQGYTFNLQNGHLIQEDKPLPAAISEGMLLLDAVPIDTLPGVEWINDPCHYVWTGGGHMGGGTTNELTDDGFRRNIVDGPMVTPDSGFDRCALGGPNVKDGLRITRFHLADRNEGGLFSGKSEVYLSASFWKSNTINSTLRTNTEGHHSLFVLDNNVSCNLSFGKELARVAPSDIGVGNATVITPAGYDWRIIENGFCQGFGYDRILVTIYEKDQVQNAGTLISVSHTDWGTVDTCLHHYLPMTMASDIWFSNAGFILSPQDFTNNNDRLWLVEVPGGFAKFTSQPTNSYSWFEVELY